MCGIFLNMEYRRPEGLSVTGILLRLHSKVLQKVYTNDRKVSRLVTRSLMSVSGL